MKKIVIAPYQMHANLLKKYRQENVFSDVKTITKERLINDYYGSIDDSAIPFVMKKYHYSYDNTVASPALARRFLTTVPPGKPNQSLSGKLVM